MPSRQRKRKAKLKARYTDNKEEILAKRHSQEAKAMARSLYKKKSEVKRDEERRKYRKNRERQLDAKRKLYHNHAKTERAGV